MKIHRNLCCLFGLLGCLAGQAQTEYVDLFMGTSGDCGQVSPGAAVPFGMVSVCPDSDPPRHAGYDYAVCRVSGISVNRLSGVGCSGAGGNLRIRPAGPSVDLELIKASEKAVPGYYRTCFNNGVSAELTATANIACERYTFPAGSEAALWIDFASSFEPGASAQYEITSDTTLCGSLTARNVCGQGAYTLWFSLSSNRPFKTAGCSSDKAVLRFAEPGKKARRESGHVPVEIRIALSPLDTSTAAALLSAASPRSFDQVKDEAARLWQEKLSAIRIKGGTEEQRRIFYTSFYRVCLSPADVTSPDRRFRGTDGKVYNGGPADEAGKTAAATIPAEIACPGDFRYYSSWSLWDTFRSKFPLLVLTDPALMRDVARSLVWLYRTGKANWSTAFESTPTVRTEHAAILLLDAYRKGVAGIDFRPGYEGMKQEAEQLPTDSPDRAMEAVYDLWALSQIAEIVGEKADAQRFGQRSEQLFESTWKKEFLTVTPDFVRMKGNGLYQGTRWQYRWAAPQYLDRMIAWAGKDTLLAQLNYFFDHALYNQGNEPDIHVPYLFNRLGAPGKTQEWVRRLVTGETIHAYGGNAEFPEPYVGKAFKDDPQGYCPEMDEDDGTMSAWYMFGCMGFYPMLVGSDEYELTSPVFDEIRLATAPGVVFTIRARGRRSPDAPIRHILLNGKLLPDYRLRHADLVKGGTLEFEYD